MARFKVHPGGHIEVSQQDIEHFAVRVARA